MYLVSGITGQVGGSVARSLLNHGHKVRGVVRNKASARFWSEKGVELIEGDMNDSEVVSNALTGVKAAFLMMFPVLAPEPGHASAKELIKSYLRALHKVPPPKLVLLSSVGSEKPSGLGNITQTHLMEEALGDQSFPVGIVRAGSFIENYAYAVKQAEFTGSFDIFLQPHDKKFPMVASEDIGKEIAKLLSENWIGKRIIELGNFLSPDDLARAVSDVLGKNVIVRSVPKNQWPESLKQIGLPKGKTGQYEEMLDGFNSGWINFGVTGTEHVTGTISPADVFSKAKGN